MKRALIVIGCSVLLAACGRHPSNDLGQLAAVEVREYQGERLGSILDFRENSIKGPQTVDIGTYRLEVTGLVDKPRSFTYKEVLALPTYSKVITLYCVEGWSVKVLWEGVMISDILAQAGLKPGANTIIFHSYDGYTTSLPLAFIEDNDILLAYKMNGVVLPPERGFPFQVAAESKLGYKWAKWVVKIEVSGDSNYKGYWESRGFSNEADI
jgi:DMSO/TMAO reductase YedYZ molybdopterin-dependent catalytic subunit